jgi:hypothetical protein
MDELFEVEPVEPLREGDRVWARTISGDRLATFVGHADDHGWPLGEVEFASGERALLNICSIRRR